MGVLNITPDSFSDGGLYFERNQLPFQLNKIHILDIGAESTAPHNPSIKEHEEIKRFESFFEKMTFNFPMISIDTYRSETFRYCYDFLNSRCERILWNDVSGCCDEIEWALSLSPKVFYVLSHNLAPNRSETGNHMNYIEEKLSITDYFEDKLSRIDKKYHERIILDPCFGFSKTRQQNLELLENLSGFRHYFKQFTVLLGISKKSFMQSKTAEILGRDLFEKSPQLRQKSEYLHCSYLKKWMEQFRHLTTIYRVHDPDIYIMAKMTQ